MTTPNDTIRAIVREEIAKAEETRQAETARRLTRIVEAGEPLQDQVERALERFGMLEP